MLFVLDFEEQVVLEAYELQLNRKCSVLWNDRFVAVQHNHLVLINDVLVIVYTIVPGCKTVIQCMC